MHAVKEKKKRKAKTVKKGFSSHHLSNFLRVNVFKAKFPAYKAAIFFDLS